MTAPPITDVEYVVLDGLDEAVPCDFQELCIGNDQPAAWWLRFRGRECGLGIDNELVLLCAPCKEWVLEQRAACECGRDYAVKDYLIAMGPL